MAASLPIPGGMLTLDCVTLGGRLLLVEDDQDLAENLAEILENHGHRVDVASSAEQALDRIAAEHYDGVITDFRLPGLNGVELVDALRKKDVPVPVVLVSAVIDAPASERANRQGVVEILEKPLDPARFSRLVGDLVTPQTEVLIVEDNAELAENLAEALASEGMSTAIGCSYAEVESRRGLVKLALVDLRLPDRSGLEVAEWLITRDPRTRLIFLTGHARDLEKPSEAHAWLEHAPVVEKPADVQQLIARIRTLLEEP